MSQLCTAWMPAFKNSAVDHDSASDTCAERKKYCAVASFGRPFYGLSKRRAISIVVDINRNCEIFIQLLCQRHIVPADIVRIQYDAVFTVDRSRTPNANPQTVVYLITALFQQLFRRKSHICDYLLKRTFPVRWNGCLCQNLILRVYNTNFYPGSAKINSYDNIFLHF